MQSIIRRVPRIALVLVVASAALLAGCIGGTHSRGQFHGYVVGVAAEEIEGRMGKPVAVDASDPKQPRWVYEKKTFDPDNFNQVDQKTTIILERKDGKLVGADVLFG